jgi:hypothetical protein
MGRTRRRATGWSISPLRVKKVNNFTQARFRDKQTVFALWLQRRVKLLATCDKLRILNNPHAWSEAHYGQLRREPQFSGKRSVADEADCSYTFDVADRNSTSMDNLATEYPNRRATPHCALHSMVDGHAAVSSV